MDNSLTPTDWRWRLEDGSLVPVESDCPVAPNFLLNIVACGCKADRCNISCGCKKLGSFCTSMCDKCMGKTCNNSTPKLLDSDSEDDMSPTTQTIEYEEE